MANTKPIDLDLFRMASGIIMSLSVVIIGCYFSVSTRLTRIETVLFMQGHLLKELIAHNKQEK